MNRTLKAMSAAAFVAALALPFAATAQQGNTKIGSLTCDISGGLGLIIASKKDIQCLYTPAAVGAPREVYVGAISKLGIDIGATTGGSLLWDVFSPTQGGPAALAGNYAGATAEATVGAGLGANVLVGGSNRTIALQPLSVQGQTGLNVAAGVTELILRPAR